MMVTSYGGQDRQSTKSKLARELTVLGSVLRRVRQTSGLKQSAVAARLGLPASHLSKIEKGTRRVDVIELLQIANALGIDPADIVRELALELAKLKVQ